MGENIRRLKQKKKLIFCGRRKKIKNLFVLIVREKFFMIDENWYDTSQPLSLLFMVKARGFK